VGRLDNTANTRFARVELTLGCPFGRPGPPATGVPLGGTFDRSAWEAATEKVQNTYSNNGYINAHVVAEQVRRTLPDSTPVLDLRWRIEEGQPAIVGMIEFRGNEVTHDRVIREAVVMVPGELFNRERLLRSYQNISNLGFFQQPMPIPDMEFVDDGATVNITFRMEEKHTGNINFGASVGQGTGLGGFLGLEEPNLFGRGKRGRLQWQFGQNINDFTLSYTDPAIMESRVSGTFSVYDSRLKYVIGDLGRRRQAGGSMQFGLPFLGSRYSRMFASYGFQKIRYDQGSADLQSRFRCSPCSRSTVGLSFLRDTRVGLPFPIAGSMISVGAEQNGGFLGGDGNYQKIDLDTKWFAPLGSLGSKTQGFGGGVQFTLGLTAKSGFIFGNPASFFTELYSLGGVQYGIPLRGYSEFSITPHGYDANASGSLASPDAFGKAYAAFTVEAGARVSQSLYLNLWGDAGNVYRNVRAYDPTRLFRGAGVGVSLVSPLGPLGLDLGYGFDKTDLLGHPAPGFQVHFRLGNIGQ
jgi:outer membrane protein insertion porin family